MINPKRRMCTLTLVILVSLALSIYVPQWSTFLKENRNIKHVLQLSFANSKEAIHERYKDINKLGKSIKQRYSDFQEWGKSLATINETPSKIQRYKPKTCGLKTQSHRSIFYVKIHDTKSDILRKIFLTYGREYNLTICMDALKIWSANWPYKVDQHGMTKTNKERCQIVAEQLVYSSEIGKTFFLDKRTISTECFYIIY